MRRKACSKQFSHACGAGLWLVVAGLLLVLALVPVGISYSNTINPNGIIIHHSAVVLTREGLPVNAAVLENAHRQRGFGTFYWGQTYYTGYHYIIYSDGKIEQGRPERCLGAHALGYNSTLGICLIGNFSSTDNPNGAQGSLAPSAAQMKALTELVNSLRNRYQIPIQNIQTHHQVNESTECPGDRFPFGTLLKEIER